jgi:hypothetical protein
LCRTDTLKAAFGGTIVSLHLSQNLQ